MGYRALSNPFAAANLSNFLAHTIKYAAIFIFLFRLVALRELFYSLILIFSHFYCIFSFILVQLTLVRFFLYQIGFSMTYFEVCSRDPIAESF